jgi:hypothetical protein
MKGREKKSAGPFVPQAMVSSSNPNGRDERMHFFDGFRCLAAAGTMVLGLAAATPARADIWGSTFGELRQDGRARRSQTSYYQTAPYSDLYGGRTSTTIHTSYLDASVLDQLIPIARVVSDIVSIARGDGILVNGISLIGDTEAAIRSFDDEARFETKKWEVVYPHTQYNRVALRFKGGTDDDPIDVLRPTENAFVSVTGYANTREFDLTVIVDLDEVRRRFGPIQDRTVIPIVFGVRERPPSTPWKNLSLLHVVNVVIRTAREPQEAIDLDVSWMNGTTRNGYDALHYKPANRTNAEVGSPFQELTLPLRYERGGRLVDSGGRPVTKVSVTFYVRSHRVYKAFIPLAQVAFDGYHPANPLPARIQPRTSQPSATTDEDERGRLYRREGTGSVSFSFDPRGIAPGTYWFYFRALRPGVWATATQVLKITVAPAPGTGGGGGTPN